jgi:hypothetical protein
MEAYLGKLRSRLRGVNDAEVQEIVEELRSHIMEKAGPAAEMTCPGVDAALAALGPPEELAGQYLTDHLLAQAEISRSPWRILKSLFRWASLSVAGFFVLLGSIVGYFSGGVLALVAVMKLIHPKTAGLWILQQSDGDLLFSFRLGFEGPPEGYRDVLGRWIIPVGWLAGCGLVMLTTYVAIWFVRRYRKTLALP